VNKAYTVSKYYLLVALQGRGRGGHARPPCHKEAYLRLVATIHGFPRGHMHWVV
jgi:hypothetical protein